MESAKLRVICALTNYRHRALEVLVSNILFALFALHVLMRHVPCDLFALVSHLSLVLRVLLPHFARAFHEAMPHVLSCLTFLVPHELSCVSSLTCFMYFLSSKLPCISLSRSSCIYCPLCLRCFSYLIFFFDLDYNSSLRHPASNKARLKITVNFHRCNSLLGLCNKRFKFCFH